MSYLLDLVNTGNIISVQDVQCMSTCERRIDESHCPCVIQDNGYNELGLLFK